MSDVNKGLIAKFEALQDAKKKQDECFQALMEAMKGSL